jgi:hypothetical protein
VSTRTAGEPKRRRARWAKPKWERAYRSHGFWQGNLKLGSVRLAPTNDPGGRYVWLAGTHTGRASTLREAKRAVEQAVLIGASQLPLFSVEDAPALR